MELIDIAENPADATEAFKTVYRILWSFYLRNVDANQAMPALTQDALSALVDHHEGCEHIYELYSFAMKSANDVLLEAKSESPNINKYSKAYSTFV